MNKTILAYPIVVLIKLYQLLIAPLLVPSCRFFPSCSAYSVEAFQRYGLIKGFYLTLGRVLRCHPFHPGGYDPVK